MSSTRWPENGKAWIHPDDVKLVRGLIPGSRVFRRDHFDGQYNLMRYGDASFRVRPTLWQVVKPEGFDVGDWVEIRSLLGKNEPGLARIREMHWHEGTGEIRYLIDRANARQQAARSNGLRISGIVVERGRYYAAEDLQPVSHIPLEGVGSAERKVLRTED